MRTRGVVAVVGMVAVLGLAACSSDGDDESSSTTSSRDVTFNVDMTGAAEVPGPGATDATGTARITVTPGGTDVCSTLTVDGLDDVVAAHIHEGRAGTAGPIAVTLMAPIRGSAEGCVTTTPSIVDALAEGTRSFYVNVHTNEFPDGAVRAQLTGG